MNTGMTCEELRDFYELYALGVLEAEEQSALEEHLARGCETCSQGLLRARALNAAMLTFIPEERPSSKLRHRVLGMVGAERPRWTWAAAIAAACALALAVWLGTEERDRTRELAGARQDLLRITGERDRLNQALAFLQQPETKAVGFGRGQTAPPKGYVFVNQTMGVMLIASNLPQAGTGKTYEMWVIPKGPDGKATAPRPAGLFQSDGSRGLHILSGPIDPTMIAAIAVTLEPEAGSPAPTSTPMIVAPVGS
jgi:hypothetical protein